MKVVYTKRFPPGRYVAINLLGVVFAKRRLTERALTHEWIHTAQMQEMWYAGFYVWYVAEFVIRLAITMNWRRAYRSVSFEREAYANEDKAFYPAWRRGFGWVAYLRGTPPPP